MSSFICLMYYVTAGAPISCRMDTLDGHYLVLRKAVTIAIPSWQKQARITIVIQYIFFNISDNMLWVWYCEYDLSLEVIFDNSLSMDVVILYVHIIQVIIYSAERERTVDHHVCRLTDCTCRTSFFIPLYAFVTKPVIAWIKQHGNYKMWVKNW